MFGPDFWERAIIAAPAILFALTVHEFFHAYTAFRASGFRFGWAKPVPVNLLRLRDPRKANFWVSAAGPLSNLGLAFIFGTIFRAISIMSVPIPEAVFMFLYFSVMINVSLAFFNLIPLFPLDGSHILQSILPPERAAMLESIQRFSPIILIVLIFSGITWVILGPFIRLFVYLFSGISIG